MARLPKNMTTPRLLIVCVVSLLLAGYTFFSAWAGLDLGFVRCDGRFGLFEKPGCRLPVVFWLATMVLVVLACTAAGVAVVRGWRAWRRSSHAPRAFRW